MILCAILPDFELLTASSGEREALEGPVAIAPLPGEAQALGRVSQAAESHGVHAGMSLGEAFARCPRLRLLNADPVRAEELWGQALVRIEALGARVEPGHPGEAYLEIDGLLAMHGGRDALAGAVRKAVSLENDLFRDSVRMGVASGPFAARIAAGVEHASEAPGTDLTGPAGAPYRLTRHPQKLLSPLPVRNLLLGLDRKPPDHRRDRMDREPFTLIRELERLGIATLGSLGQLEPSLVADRFGRLGLRARRLALGESEKLRPRIPAESLQATLDLPDSADGFLLENALRLLIDRFLALPARRGRPLRSVVLSATLSGGGSWRTRTAFNTPASSPEMLRLTLTPRLAALPGPASSMSISSDRLGSPYPAQERLASRPEEMRRGRINEAIRQTRAVAGEDSILRILTVSPDARLPEERVLLSPRDPEAS